MGLCPIDEADSATPNPAGCSELNEWGIVVFEEKKNNGLTIGITICAAVVVLVVFVLFINSSKRNAEDVVSGSATVPSFVGMQVSEIEQGEFLFDIREGNDSDYKTGEVLSQNPVPGSPCSLGDRIELVVNGQAEIPNMKDYKIEDAEKLVRVTGLSPRIEEEFDDDVEKGLVIKSDPEFGSKVDFRSQVRLVVSKGPDPSFVKIPDLKGQKDSDAMQALIELGLDPVLDFEDSEDVEPGCVIETEPKAGEKVRHNASVVLKINNSPDAKMVKVPDGLVGKKYSEVATSLRDIGLTIGGVTWDDDSREAKDIVIKMSVTPGSEVEEGTVVTMVVSTGAGAPKKLSKSIDLPRLDDAYELEIWKNGDMVESAIIVPTDTDPYKLAFEGVTGSDKIMLIIEDMVYAQLTFNYDDEKVTIDSLNSNMFVSSSPSPSPSISPSASPYA